MSNYIVMYHSNGMLYMFYINDSNEDEVYHIASSRYNEFIFKETFFKYIWTSDEKRELKRSNRRLYKWHHDNKKLE